MNLRLFHQFRKSCLDDIPLLKRDCIGNQKSMLSDSSTTVSLPSGDAERQQIDSDASRHDAAPQQNDSVATNSKTQLSQQGDDGECIATRY